MSIDSELSFDDLIRFAGQEASGPAAARTPGAAPEPAPAPVAAREASPEASGPVRASAHVNGEEPLRRPRGDCRSQPAPQKSVAPEPVAPEAVAPKPVAPLPVAPAPVVAEPKPQPVTRAPKPAKASRKGEHYRPELHSTWARFSGNLAVRIIGFTILAAGTAALIYLAVTRY